MNPFIVAERKTTTTKLTGLFSAATLPALLAAMWYKHQFLNDLRQLYTQQHYETDNKKARTLVKLLTGQAPERCLDDQDKEGFRKIWQTDIEKFGPYCKKVLDSLGAKYHTKSQAIEEGPEKEVKLQRYAEEVLHPQRISGLANTEANALILLAINASGINPYKITLRTPSNLFDRMGQAYANGRQDD